MDLCCSQKRKVRILNFYGTNTSTALKNILARKEEKLNHKTNSKKKIKSALIVQGGCMRGVFSAGSLLALEKMGFTQGFDAVYGSSGGAINASYFLANQGPFGASIYYEDINNSKFINILRVNKIVDIDYLFDEVVTRIKPLYVNQVTNAKTPLYFFVTDIEEGTAKRFNAKSCGNFLKSLKASCALPVYYNKPVFVDAKGYLDGGICKAIPIQDAINDGCTDILVLLTQPTKDSTNFFGDFLVKKFLSKFGSKLVNAFFTCLNEYSYAFDVSLGNVKIKKKVNIATIVPDSNFNLNRLTKSEKLLKEVAIDGAKKVFDLFEQKFDMSDILRYN